MTTIRCYDCGKSSRDPERLDGFLICSHCSELLTLDEGIGPIRALIRRALFRWHSNTADRHAAGWRHPKGIL